MDKIVIKGLRIFAYHGVNPEEKEKGQPFVLDITLYKDLSLPGATDDLNDTVNYSRVAKTATRVMLAQKDDLIERAASRVAEAVLAEFPEISNMWRWKLRGGRRRRWYEPGRGGSGGQSGRQGILPADGGIVPGSTAGDTSGRLLPRIRNRSGRVS